MCARRFDAVSAAGKYVRSKRRRGDATIRSVIAKGVAPPA